MATMKAQDLAMELEPTTFAFIKQVMAAGGPPIYKLSIPEARSILDTLQAQPVEKQPAQIEDLTIPAGPRGEISIRIIRPEKNKAALPCAMYFHGGGWILGNKNTHDRLVREIANGANCAVVFVNYAPSPEAQYPIAIEQAYAATEYMAKHASQYKLDSQHLAIVGDSVGGNMAAVVALLAKERKGPKICHQVLFYPVTDANFNTESYQQFADGPWLTKAAMEWFWKAYCPDVSARKKHTICPLQASLEQLQNLPATLLITDENDVLRDEGEAYAHKLMQAGVDVVSMRFIGTCHDFVMLNPLAKTPACLQAITLACETLKKAFSK